MSERMTRLDASEPAVTRRGDHDRPAKRRSAVTGSVPA